MLIPMIDYLSFSVDVEQYTNSINRYLDELNRLKNLAKEYSANKTTDKAVINIGGSTYEVLANGANGYAFILHNSEYEVKLAQFRSKNNNFNPIKIRVYSECLWSKGPAIAFNDIYVWVKENFGLIIDNKISRLDLCCHVDSLRIDYEMIGDFKGLYRQKNIREYNRAICGLEFGSRSCKVFCRIYDKTLEVIQKRTKLWFFDIWESNGLNTVQIWNVEFELKREFFKDYGIETVEDAVDYLNSIWKHCTEEWLVLTNNDKTRIENSSKNEVWQEISNSFSCYISKPLIKRVKQLEADADALIPATIGNITTVAARLGESNIIEAWAVIKEKGERYLKRKSVTYKEQINEKISLL